MHMLTQIEMDSIQQQNDPQALSDMDSYQNTIQNTMNNNDNSFLKNAPQTYESSFAKVIAPSAMSSH